MKRQPLCCARRQSAVSIAQADLHKLARKVVRRPSQRGLDLIAAAKASLAGAKQNQVDHEAEHAGQAVA